MRTRTVEVGSKEEIIEYTHNLGGIVRCLVGHGEEDESGKFIPTPSQNYEVYEITEAAYEELMAANTETGKPKGTFRKEDLWAFIDGTRETRLARAQQVKNGR